MNCEMAEENLSAYLDDMLDPPERAAIQEHLDGCVRCREILDDYRHFDTVLAHLPPVAPPDTLRARIFESPEYLALVREQQAAGDHGQDQPAAQRPATAPPGWRKIGLQVAAAVLVVIGSALLIKQGLFTSKSQTGGVLTSTLGNPGQTGVPLAAGNRLVFSYGNALWSAPENGPGLAQQLTPKGVVVGAFAVSPDGRYVVYVDDIHGALHVIRSDGQSDTTIVPGHGLQILGMPVWSPDGQQIAYVANSLSGLQLHLVNSTGTNNRVISTADGATVSRFGAPIWSADGLRVAWVQDNSGGQSLWTYDLVAHVARQVAAQADPAVAGSRFRDVVWLPDTLHPALSWAATDASAIPINGTARPQTTGIFTLTLANGTPRRLTAAGVTFSWGIYNATRGNGAWLLVPAGSASTLWMVSADNGTTLAATTAQQTVTAAFASPNGSTIAYVTASGELFVWTPGGATTHLLSGVTGLPYWAPDGSHLAVATTTGVVSVAASGASSSVATPLVSDAQQGVLAVIWAPDGHAVAVNSANGLVIVASDGAPSRAIEHGTVDGLLEWSVAG
jgi:Tol biopolymer transport system component